MELNKEQEVYSAVVQRAWEDETFKQELMDSPAAAIQRATGEEIEIPAGKTMVVSDQSNPSYAYLNIPPRPDMDNLELSDEQLEMVSGGEFLVSTIVIATIGAATASATLTYTIGKDKKKKETTTTNE